MPSADLALQHTGALTEAELGVSRLARPFQMTTDMSMPDISTRKYEEADK